MIVMNVNIKLFSSKKIIKKSIFSRNNKYIKRIE